MIEPPRERIDPRQAMRSSIEWELDPEHRLWFRGMLDGQRVYLRLNKAFPDVPLYSLLIAEDETFELEDLPAPWRRPTDLTWPDTAVEYPGPTLR